MARKIKTVIEDTPVSEDEEHRSSSNSAGGGRHRSGRAKDNDEDENDNDSIDNDINIDLKDGSKAVLRTILTRHTRYQTIRREHLSQALTVAGFKQGKAGLIDNVIDTVKQDLNDIFGFQLMVVPEIKDNFNHQDGALKKKRKHNNGKATTSTTKNAPMGLVSSLDEKAKSVLGKLYQKDVGKQVSNNRNTNDAQFYLPKYTKFDSPLSNQELIKSGITSLIVSLLITSENHSSEYDLIKVLKSFGIPDSLNHKIPNLSINLQEFLNELVKRDYIVKHVQDNVTEFSLGTRSFMEFSPSSVMGFIKEIYGPKFDIDTRKRVAVTIQRLFGETIDKILEDEEDEEREAEENRDGDGDGERENEDEDEDEDNDNNNDNE